MQVSLVYSILGRAHLAHPLCEQLLFVLRVSQRGQRLGTCQPQILSAHSLRRAQRQSSQKMDDLTGSLLTRRFIMQVPPGHPFLGRAHGAHPLREQLLLQEADGDGAGGAAAGRAPGGGLQADEQVDQEGGHLQKGLRHHPGQPEVSGKVPLFLALKRFSLSSSVLCLFLWPC
jgi:hypothetical protein